MILGTLLYATGLSAKADRALGERVPFLQERIDGKAKFWNNPEEGKLIGIVKSIESDRVIILDSFGEEWTVNLSNEINTERIRERMKVVVIGEAVEEDVFEASKLIDMLRIKDRRKPPRR